MIGKKKLVLVIIIIFLLFTISHSARRRSRGGRVRVNPAGISQTGRGIALFIKSLLGYEVQQQEETRDIPPSPGTMKISDVSEDTWINVIVVLTAISIAMGICLYIVYSNQNRVKLSQSYADIRSKQSADMKKLQYMRDHGVHPDRANGKIYKVKLK